MRHYRSAILLICFAGISCPSLLAQQSSLAVGRRGDRLYMTAPHLHFLVAKPLEQLQNGASVTYEFVLAAAGASSGRPFYTQQEAFVVSFDLWEERFSVVPTSPRLHSGSHLTAAEAEAWCVDALSVPLSVLPPEKSFVIKLTCQVAANESDADTHPLTLAGLIDVFSRKGHEAPMRWEAVSASLHRADLKEKQQIQARRLAKLAWTMLDEQISGIPARFWQMLLGW